MSVKFDASKFPVVTIRFLGEVSEGDVTQAGLQILGLLQRKAPFVLISDMTDGAPSAAQGKALSALMEQKRDDFRTYMRGNCLVVTSPLLRAGLRAALLAVKPPFAVLIESNTTAAEGAAARMLGR